MFTKLIEASRRQIKRGAYQLTFDERNKTVKVLYAKNGKLSYVVSGDNDDMLFATVVYFGLRH